MEDVVFEVRPGRRLNLSISVGAAIYPHDGETYEALLATGDARMYRDKTMRKQLARPVSARLKDRPRPAPTTRRRRRASRRSRSNARAPEYPDPRSAASG